VFPKTADPAALRAQKLVARVLADPAVQLSFNKLKGSIPVHPDVDVGQLDACARKGMAIVADRSRPLGVMEIYLTPDRNGALQDVLTAYWNTGMSVDQAQNSIASALRY
jgi:glucose/mannose transport system substrate-binding protein